MPEVSVGMPVYNGAQYLERALTSLLRQSFEDFELIISDNASTDGTSEICQRFARADRRIRYVRQGTNVGALKNFIYVLEQAAAPYFMWAAHDDAWEPDFIAANHEVLSTRDDVVLSVSQVEFVNEQGEAVDVGCTGTYPLLGGPRENLVRYLSDPAQNSRCYGLQRTEVLRHCMRDTRSMWADDWLIMARTLKFGKHFEVPRCLLWRSPDGNSSNALALIARLHKSSLVRAMPMLPYTWAVLTDPLIPKTLGIARPLYRWNKYYADQILARRVQECRVACRRLKQLVVRTRPRIDHAYASAATVRTIQRLLAEPLIDHRSAIEQYPVPGAIIDGNALLDIPGDGDFVEAAFRQVLGREIPDKARRKWLTRLKWIPRACMLARLRSTTRGRAHAVQIPGLWRALFLDSPRRGWLRLPLVASTLDRARRHVVAQCLRQRLAGRVRTSLPAHATVLAEQPVSTDGSVPHLDYRKAS